MRVRESFRSRSGWGLRRFDASMRRVQMQVWLRFVQVWCLYVKDSEHDWVRFVQFWCLYEKDSEARLGEVCAGLMLEWEGFRRRRLRGLCRFDASMRRIQTQEWVGFVQVWWVYEKDSDAGVGEVCAGLMLVWEGFRRRSLWGLGGFDACMRKIQTQEWVRFVQVWFKHEKDSDPRVGEVCAGLIQAWEGFWCKSGWGLCRFDAFYEKDSEAGLGEVCAGLMLVWEGLRRRSLWGLCRFDACTRKFQKQEWVRFAQVWCKHEKDSDASVVEICAGLMLVWEGFRARLGEVCAVLMLVWEGFRGTIGWGLCRFDAGLRIIQTQEWARFVQVWCLYEKNSVAGVGEIFAGLMQAWERFRRRSGWGLRRFDASMRRIQMQDWLRFVQVWCSYEKDLDAGVSEVCAGLVHAWEGFRRKSGWG